jgi:hypothetical protein
VTMPTLPDLREIYMGYGVAADALLPGMMEMARFFCLIHGDVRGEPARHSDSKMRAGGTGRRRGPFAGGS